MGGEKSDAIGLVFERRDGSCKILRSVERIAFILTASIKGAPLECFSHSQSEGCKAEAESVGLNSTSESSS